MVSGKYDLRGRFPPRYQDYEWLAREWNFLDQDSPILDREGQPFDAGISIRHGVTRLQDEDVRLLTVEGDTWVLDGWDEFYAPRSVSTHRVRKFRTHQLARNLDVEVGAFHETARNGETGETLHTPPTSHTTHMELRDAESVPDDSVGEGAPPSPGKLLQGLWNEITTAPLPRWRDLTKKRSIAAAARFKENPDEGYWRDVMKRIEASTFCRGGGHTSWVADPEFLLRPDTHVKVMEGKYDNRGQAGQPALREHKSGNKLY